MQKLTCFKAYDIRGQLGTEINPEIVYRIGRAYASFVQPQTVVVGADVRLTSNQLKNSVIKGLLDSGVNVIDLGLTGTEEVYFATNHLNADGGIQITASHNPMDYNGLKLVTKGARPLSMDSGLAEIQKLAEDDGFTFGGCRGDYRQHSILADYIQHLLGYINFKNLKPLKLVINSGNGAGGHVIDALEAIFQAKLAPIEIIKIHNNPDGNFPNGIPNPLLHDNRQDTIDAVIAHNADMGIAFDGDFDRCFLFDEKGSFIEGYYIVGLLAQAFLSKEQGAKIIYDPRLIWNTHQIVSKNGGVGVLSKSGHSFIKQKMREINAIYGGEMSAHHYFRDFFYCDSGMIPWLLVMELLCNTDKTLSELVNESIDRFPSPGEINSKLQDAPSALERVRNHYTPLALNYSDIDGMSFEFTDWRFNLRSSNTEPVVRLNLETRGNRELMEEKTAEVLALLRQ